MIATVGEERAPGATGVARDLVAVVRGALLEPPARHVARGHLAAMFAAADAMRGGTGAFPILALDD